MQHNLGQNLLNQIVGFIFSASIIFAFYKNYRLHSYYGITLDINVAKFIIFVFFNMLYVAIFSKYKLKKLTLASIIMYFFVVAPINAYYVSANQSSAFFFAVNCSFFLFIFITTFLPTFNIIKIKSDQANLIYVSGLIFFIVIVFSWFLYSQGLPGMELLDISSVYTFRKELSQPAAIEYFRSFVVYAIVPIICFIFLEKKKIFLLLCAMSINFIIYLYTGSRFIFVLNFLIIPFFILSKNNNPVLLSMIAFIFLYIVSGILTDTDFYFISHFIFFRPIEIPAWLSFVYHDYFLLDGFYYYSESFEIFNIDNKAPAPRIIGDFVFPQDGTTWANVGFFGHAFYNLGYVGIFLNSILLGIIFWFTFSITSNIKVITKPTIMLYCFFLANFGILTMLINRGFIIVMAFLFLYSSIYNVKNK